MPEQARLNAQLLRLAPEAGLPLVVTNDLHYVHKAQAEAHDVLLCVGTGSNLDTPNRLKFEGAEFYLKSAAEMFALFPEQREAYLNTRRIAEMVDLELPLGQLRIPHFPVPEGETVDSWLRAECERGLARRYGTVTPELQARLDYELGVITRMDYAGYFLIVADFVRFAREQGIQTSCRGSAPGSIVTYTLGITPVDPIHYQLPFERFLNPDRVTMPDIDVDFEDGRRDEVINYVTRKYGADHVAQIITFGTMLARAAIRDVGRVLGSSYGDVDRIAKAVPNQLGIKLDEALETSPQLKEMYTGDPSVRRIIDFAKQLEGVARNASTHAAGVVISREPLTELMPLQRATNSDAAMTQYEMHGIEALGLLKFDFLGLSNLTILRAAVDLVREQRGVEIDLDRIPLDDTRTFELLASGETTGVFQLESAGMRRYIRELRPTSVYDLAAMVALYRPGPMDNIPAYIRRKHGQEKVTYLHPLLEPFLERTYGIFVYQEDIMAAAVALGGFSGPEADTLGYAIRKKKSSVLRSMKDQFVTQAGERGVRPETIDAVFKAFEPFERYGFNKAHATTYGLVAYQTAYLKANYTVEYMASVLTAFRDNAEKVAAAVAECRRLGIAVLPPDVHASHLEFTVEGAAIRFGLLAVKNVGHGAIESIIAAREADGPFRSFADFCNRIDLRLVNKRVLESLVKVGALNAFGHPAQLLLALDDVLAAAQSDQRERASGQISFFDLAAEPAALEAPLPAATEVPVRERLRWEKELLGLYLSDHPLGEVAERIGKFVTAYSGDLKDESLDGEHIVVGGVVTGIRSVVTKSRSTMAIVTLEDLQGSIEVVVFPRLYEQTGPTWQDGAILLVGGRIDHRGEEVSLLADLVRDFDAATVTGEETFAAEVAAADRGRPRGRPGGNGNGRGGAPDAGRPPVRTPGGAGAQPGRRRTRRGWRHRPGYLTAQRSFGGGPAAHVADPRRRAHRADRRRRTGRHGWRRCARRAHGHCSRARARILRAGRPRSRRPRPRGARVPGGDARRGPSDGSRAHRPARGRSGGVPARPLRGRPPDGGSPGRHGRGPGRPARPPGRHARHDPPAAGDGTAGPADGAASRRGLRRRADGGGHEAAAAGARGPVADGRRRRDGRVRLISAAPRAPRDGRAPRASGPRRAGRGSDCRVRGEWPRRVTPGQPPWTAFIARTTESCSRCAERTASKSAGSISSSLAISLRTALSGDEISSSAAATWKQARSTPRRCSMVDTRLNSRVTR